MKVSAVVAAAGEGRRMNEVVEKPYLLLAGKPILAHTLLGLARLKVIDEIILVVSEARLGQAEKIVADYHIEKIKKVVRGGKSRTESVNQGLQEVGEESKIVLIHDGVRPFVDQRVVEETVALAAATGSAVAAVPLQASIKKVDSSGEVIRSLERDGLWLIQTPQAFQRSLIVEAYRRAMSEGTIASDDAALVERMGLRVKTVRSSYYNVKITTPEDLILARLILKKGTGYFS